MSARLEFAEVVSKPTRRSTISTAVKRRGLMARAVAGEGSVVGLLGRARVADHRQELAPRGGIGAELAEHAARHHGDAGLVDAPSRHALMGRLDADGDALGLEHLV